MHKYTPLVLIISLLIMTAVGAAWLTGPENNNQTPPQQPLDNNTGGEQPDPPQESKLKQYALQLSRSLTTDEKTKLESIAESAGSLGGNTILVRAPEDRQGELQSLPFVESTREYLPVQKTGDKIKSSTGQSQKVKVTITLFSGDDQNDVINLIQKLGGSVTEKQGRYLRAEIPGFSIDKLTASPAVMFVEENEEPELLNNRAKDITGARPLAIPGFLTEPGLTGEGQTLGLADSGLDTGSMGNLHPDLESLPGRKPRVIMLKSWAGVETPADTIGHGTHMAGTMVGSGQASGGLYAGLAPGASLYFQGIMDEQDNLAPPLDLRQLFSPAYDADVRIHVNAWGRKSNIYNSSASQIDKFVRRYPDFLPIFGAGNSGPRVGSLTSEANSKNSLTVGASVSPRPAFDDVLGSTGETAGFSSRGPTKDGRIKPDLLAPGTNIISTASRVVESGLPGRPEYTSLQGTSMASAVAGGAAALLRQYLQENEGMAEPSAALLKAALINGARHLDGTPSSVGFGLLDISSTVIALKNGLFNAVDNYEGITTGESAAYEIKVTDSTAPLKATLAWTDPEAMPGSPATLVNDLNLEVTAPGGEKFYGNDFNQKGISDTRNNVEQVYIPNPRPGTYKVTVHGESVAEDVTLSKGTTQDYALVFGQPPVQGVVTESAGDKVILGGGTELSPGKDITLAVNDRLSSVPEKLLPGTELYMAGNPPNGKKTYAVLRAGRVDGVKALVVDDVTVLVRMNSEQREGGYAVDNQAQGVLSLNGHPLQQGTVIPPGSSVTRYVNPHRQTLWKADITSREIKGVLSGIDPEKHQIEILNTDNIYQLAGEASLSFFDVMVGGDLADLPFGTSTPADLNNLLQGMPLNITLGSDGQVYHLAVKRYMVTGKVSEVKAATDHIILSSGGEYHVMPGIKVVRDGKPAGLEEIREGDLVMVNLVPESTRALSVNAFSSVGYGRVIYTEDDTLYLMDNEDGFSMLSFHPDITVFRWGMAAGTSSLSPGQWVRVIKDPVSGEARRVDIADLAGKVEAVLEAYNPGGNIIKTADGESYRLSSVSQVTKNGIAVKPRDLLPGEQVSITVLHGPEGEKIIAALEAETRAGVKPPELKVKSTVPFEDISLISGNTTASRLYGWFPGGKYKDIELSDAGEFYYPVQGAEAENIRLVAVDTKTGGVASLQLSLPRRATGFPDIEGHWAEIDIGNLVSRGMLKGYPDGTFRPDREVNRVEFTAMLTRLMGGSAAGADIPYDDAEDIPRWAKGAVALAHSRGLVGGYEDNTFRPYAEISREEVAVLLVRAYDILKGIPQDIEDNAPPYADRGSIAAWAREDVALARELGLLGGRPNNRLAPKDHLTRAETAAALSRLLHDLTNQTTKQPT